jgi:methylmalonyl-CoA/ethylmalonyl-CoA epimerase
MSRPTGVDHIAIAVPDLNEATQLWRDRFGLREGERELVPGQRVEVQMMYAGKMRIELVCPTSNDSPVQAFLDKKGPGIHHIALAVDDCQAAISSIQAKGAQMIDSEPKKGAHGTKVGFVHPKSSNGVLLELVEDGDISGLSS